MYFGLKYWNSKFLESGVDFCESMPIVYIQVKMIGQVQEEKEEGVRMIQTALESERQRCKVLEGDRVLCLDW